MKIKFNQIGFIDPNDLIDFIPDESKPLPSEDEAGEFPSSARPYAPSTARDLTEQEIADETLDTLLADRKVQSSIEVESILKSREDTRGRLAIIYTLCTFGVFLLAIILATVDGLNRNVSIIDNLKEILPLISGLFLGSLGFVLGYYFKRGES